MKAIIALLIAMALIIVPASAFTPTIPYSTIEAQTEEMINDYGIYSYQRTVVDDGKTLSPQNTYSGLLFGAAEGTNFNFLPLMKEGYTAGVVGNVIETTGGIYDENGDIDAGTVRSDITRQWVQQGGTASVTLAPNGIKYDPENPNNPLPTVDMSFSKSNLAWVSGDLDEFSVSPESYAAVGGNYLNEVPMELSPHCQNAWLIEREEQQPITVTAQGFNTRLLEAYAGTASNANLVMTPSMGSIDLVEDGFGNTMAVGTGTLANAKMSGYAERFAGYDDAWVSVYDDSYLTTPTYGPNKIVMDFGSDDADNLVENFWISGDGLDFDAPQYSDFPNEVAGDGIYNGQITWADEGMEDAGIP
jgi:hypothetical protein